MLALAAARLGSRGAKVLNGMPRFVQKLMGVVVLVGIDMVFKQSSRFRRARDQLRPCFACSADCSMFAIAFTAIFTPPH